ncbi:hypothetical protein M3D15_04775 [Pseudoclavibacter alba]|uniref:Uncharacterized protein n=1 Tax=Pseudoclavibacter albus TaxID=272241 RepID=A0ABT2HWF1_9MICO|nr:hypothetical protein [Pseudoclavibacter alba]MCT2042649.1 hypothetical protein [Pseudoclavibacter alba]
MTTIDRASFERDVMMNIALQDISLDVSDTSGNRPVLVALDSDLLEDVLKRAARIGGYANVFSTDGTQVRLAALIESSCALDPASAIDMATGPTSERPGAGATWGMFLDTISASGTPILVALPEHGAARPTATRPRALTFA